MLGHLWKSVEKVGVRTRDYAVLSTCTKKVYCDIYARSGGTSVEPIIVMFLFNNY